MRTFQVLVHHSRSSTPMIHVVTARDEDQARALAGRLLAASPQNLGVEVFEDEARLFTLGDVPGG